MIKTGHSSSKLAFLCITIFFLQAVSVDFPSPDDSGSCALDFQKFPYQPSGECIGDQQEVKELDSITTTLCCRQVQNAITTTLAYHAKNTSAGSLFLPEEEWRNCSGQFHRQSSVSPHSCGFDDLYDGSSACSSFPLSSLQSQWYYNRAVELCSGFNTSFDDVCTNCTQAILDARDQQLKELNVKSDNKEKSICGLAVVISVVASKVDGLDNQTLLNDFYKCLTLLDSYDSGYVKLKYSVVKPVAAVLIAFVTLLLVLLLIKYVTREKRRPPKPVIQSKEITTLSGLYRFSKAEIDNAIHYGNDKKCLGRGSAGQVYRGVLPSGQLVAIKHIHKSNSSDTFQREVDGLSRVRHKNLVCLFGYYNEGGDRYLVYEYCSAGNLAHHLLRKSSILTWDIRVKILYGCARGLRYLHRYIDGCIVHRDIKLTNILLTENLEPKLSDFGLAKMLGMEESKVFTDVRGTMGYMDPEYMSNAKLTCASDIYSFGIVALQILSGQKVIEFDLDARDQLTRKAKDASAGKRPLTDFEDPKLEGKVNKEDFQAILEIAVLCVAKSSKGRPTIDDVFEVLEKALKNIETVKFSINSCRKNSIISRSIEIL
ncbi:hypothetical protein Tsubulata_016123 [Turnera subulata]|uniref:non-specific serine/threonine protein kinase n=1 Tax=Turnera subulata TaxID=218843 RepID=A0A9Q0JQT3_9ROSI|nr:hypothetical protein Tsubulata_016123 [Turnera subulata]